MKTVSEFLKKLNDFDATKGAKPLFNTEKGIQPYLEISWRPNHYQDDNKNWVSITEYIANLYCYTRTRNISISLIETDLEKLKETLVNLLTNNESLFNLKSKE